MSIITIGNSRFGGGGFMAIGHSGQTAKQNPFYAFHKTFSKLLLPRPQIQDIDNQQHCAWMERASKK